MEAVCYKHQIILKNFFYKKTTHYNFTTMNLELNKNEDVNQLLWSEVRQKQEKIKLGGGEKAIAKLKEKNKMTARERIMHLCDEDKEFMELGSFAGYDMYAEHGGCPAGGTVGGLGYIQGKLCVIIANDPTVKAGAWFPITGKKNLRLQEIALENNLPVVYLVDSAGVYLPMQDEIFPDKEHFGRIFRNNAQMSAKGITQIAAVFGPCVAGGAYLPIMSDETLMVKDNGSIFLAGPYLVKAAVGEDIDAETLGGAHTHNAISGIADYECENELDCINKLKAIIGQINLPAVQNLARQKPTAPAVNPEQLWQIFPAGNSKPYDVHDIISCLVDANSFTAFKNEYGKTIVCGYASIDGWQVGIVANQRKIVKAEKTSGTEVQMGGVIYNDTADKAARFILNCNQKKIPLIFLQDVTGFMVGSRSEHSGIAKDGAKMVNAVANSIVPKITIIIGNSYGAGNYAMCGKAYDPRFIFAWPTAKIAVMGGEQAAKTLLQIQVAAAKSKGQPLTAEQEQEQLQTITQRYNSQTTPYYAAARLWVDEIINPTLTRQYISNCLTACNQQALPTGFSNGVFQV
jgi:3-methylcrotonyl-CoA carboxylase beta subunit